MRALAKPALQQELVPPPTDFMWLEITGRCQLKCTHCYAGSGPTGTHGSMSPKHWQRVIDQAADMGVRMVQFIGGEPTLHPHFMQLVPYALRRQLDVEVFTNLVKVDPEMWELFGTPRVQLATSYYTANAQTHNEIVNGPGAHRLTTRHIRQAVERGIPPRVGIIDIIEGQGVADAYHILREMGVTKIEYDKMRDVGRGAKTGQGGFNALCGNCVNGVLAVSPHGVVWPCVFSRKLPIGNVKITSLAELVSSSKYLKIYALLKREFDSRKTPVTPPANASLPPLFPFPIPIRSTCPTGSTCMPGDNSAPQPKPADEPQVKALQHAGGNG